MVRITRLRARFSSLSEMLEHRTQQIRARWSVDWHRVRSTSQLYDEIHGQRITFLAFLLILNSLHVTYYAVARAVERGSKNGMSWSNLAHGSRYWFQFSLIALYHGGKSMVDMSTIRVLSSFQAIFLSICCMLASGLSWTLYLGIHTSGGYPYAIQLTNFMYYKMWRCLVRRRRSLSRKWRPIWVKISTGLWEQWYTFTYNRFSACIVESAWSEQKDTSRSIAPGRHTSVNTNDLGL